MFAAAVQMNTPAAVFAACACAIAGNHAATKKPLQSSGLQSLRRFRAGTDSIEVSNNT